MLKPLKRKGSASIFGFRSHKVPENKRDSDPERRASIATTSDGIEQAQKKATLGKK
jgi:hypothetical protein